MKVNPMIVLREDFENLAILFNPDNGAVIQLNPTALFIWKELEKGATVAEVIERLHAACGDTFQKTSEPEVEHFIKQLQEKNYVIPE